MYKKLFLQPAKKETETKNYARPTEIHDEILNQQTAEMNSLKGFLMMVLMLLAIPLSIEAATGRDPDCLERCAEDASDCFNGKSLFFFSPYVNI